MNLMKLLHRFRLFKLDKACNSALLLSLILGLHVSLLLVSASRHSPVLDEVGHLPSGISHWKFRRFELYAVNPPLIRSVAAIPAVLSDVRMDWAKFDPRIANRAEVDLGRELAESNRATYRKLLTWGRWSCVPFSVIGAIVCYFWSKELWGTPAGLATTCLWCFSPNILGHAALLTPDAHSAALGVAAMYVFRRWLQAPGWQTALQAGVVLGIAELSKFTWIVLYGIFPLLWIAWTLLSPAEGRRWARRTAELALLLGISVYTINLGYLFEGSCTILKEFKFSSAALSGVPGGSLAGQNRFRETILGELPVPLPRNYILGIDHQKSEFDHKSDSYLRGERRIGGWWYYYLYAILIKAPLGTLLIFLFAVITAARSRLDAHLIKELIVLLVPAIVVLGTVSSQTGFNHHLRYVIPAFPFFFIFCGRAFAKTTWNWIFPGALSIVCLIWTISTLSYFPHGLSYFNELIGGPENGWKHLDYSNVDWGQDLYHLKAWQEAHPEAQPLYVGHFGLLDPVLFGIDSQPAHSGVHQTANGARVDPGWYIISTHLFTLPHSQMTLFRGKSPIGRVGYSYRIYRVL